LTKTIGTPPHKTDKPPLGGTVTTVDINSDVAAGARRHLDDTGLQHVTVLTRDGAEGAPEHAPFDRLIVTVGAWDILWRGGTSWSPAVG
jgi:hypothetical protein